MSIKNTLRIFIDSKFPKIASTFRYIRDSKLINEEAKLTKMGFKFSGNIQMQDGSFEQEETLAVEKILNDTDILINVGANIGYYCCIALKKNKYVLAFEPINLNLRYLLQNIQNNAFEPNIEIFPIALGSETGVAKIYGGGTGASIVEGWAGTAKNQFNFVPLNTLNNIVGRRFMGRKCFILVDIEGYELPMLKGSTILLNMNPKPVWMVEIQVAEHQPSGVQINPALLETFKIFWDAGYEAATATTKPRIVTQMEINKILDTRVDTLKTHNFIFTCNNIDEIENA
jgi:FkbM family methyltransferase